MMRETSLLKPRTNNKRKIKYDKSKPLPLIPKLNNRAQPRTIIKGFKQDHIIPQLKFILAALNDLPEFNVSK